MVVAGAIVSTRDKVRTAVPGGIGHFILLAACVAALLEGGTDNQKWRKFVFGGVMTLAYLALIVAIARPR